MRVCVRSGMSGCNQNWCHPVSFQPSNCTRTYYVCIYLLDLLLSPHLGFCCCCARILLVEILLILNLPLPQPPEANATIKVDYLKSPNTKNKFIPPLCKIVWGDRKWGNIPMVVDGSVSGADFTRSLLMTKMIFLTWPRSSFLASTFTYV